MISVLIARLRNLGLTANPQISLICVECLQVQAMIFSSTQLGKDAESISEVENP